MYINICIYKSVYSFKCIFFSYLCLDNQPKERPQINNSSIADSVNPHINISWNPLLVCEGREFLEMYVVDIRITNQGKQSDEVVRFDVNKDTTSFQYDGIHPFTTYDIQVFANTTIDDRNLLVALTSTQSFDSPESGMYVYMHVCMCVCMYVCILYVYIYICMYVYMYVCMYVYSSSTIGLVVSSTPSSSSVIGYTGLLASVSVLSVIVVTSLVAIVIFILFKILKRKPKEKERFSNN